MKTDVVTDTGGDEPAIVMIHGWGQNRLCFRPLAKRLSTCFRIITLDLAGHGKAKGESGPFSFKRYERDIASLVKNMRISRFHLLGWSMGGTIAAMYGLDRIEPCPESIILVCATPRFVSREGNFLEGQHIAAARKMERQITTDPESGLRGFIERFFESGEIIPAQTSKMIEDSLITEDFPPDTGALLETLRELVNTDLTTHHATYKGNVLIINGALDKICPSGGQKLWESLMAPSVRVTLEPAGHAPHLTLSHQVAHHITSYISSIE